VYSLFSNEQPLTFGVPKSKQLHIFLLRLICERSYSDESCNIRVVTVEIKFRNGLRLEAAPADSWWCKALSAPRSQIPTVGCD
jgi:hypothetical protein